MTIMMRHTVRFVPSWFPGAGFKRQAIVWQKRLSEIENTPFNWAKQQIVSVVIIRCWSWSNGFYSRQMLISQSVKASGEYIDSFTSQHLQPEDGHVVSVEEGEIIKYCSVALYAGGADTVSHSHTPMLSSPSLTIDLSCRPCPR